MDILTPHQQQALFELAAALAKAAEVFGSAAEDRAERIAIRHEPPVQPSSEQEPPWDTSDGVIHAHHYTPEELRPKLDAAAKTHGRKVVTELLNGKKLAAMSEDELAELNHALGELG